MIHRQSQPLGWVFVAPALFVLALLIVYPLVHTVLVSLTDESGEFVGMANYRTMAGSPLTRTAVVNTVYYVGASIAGQIVLGTCTGILLNQAFRGRGLVRALTLVPWIVPGIVAATTWAWMFHGEFGIVNGMLAGAGLVDAPVGWLTDPDTAMPALVVINVWKLFPFVATMVLAALQSVPAELYESARVDGATFWDEVRHVMLPGIRPVLAAVTLLLLIWGLNAITIVYTVTRGGPANRTLIVPLQIYRHAFEAFRPHEAAALAVLFFAAALGFVALYVRRATGAGHGDER
jgi:multiple sugar transport system permease protein